MSKEIIPANFQVPDYLRDQSNEIATDVAGGITSGAVPQISFKGGRFRIKVDGNETVLDTLAIGVVIIGANKYVSKVYYEKNFDEETAEAPDCFSNDGIRPDPAAKKKQHSNCAECPMNVWGSKVSERGKEIKACSDRKLIAVTASDQISGTIYQMNLPPTSLRGLRAYVNELGRRHLPVNGVVTKVTFDSEVSHPLPLFSFGGPLSQEAFEQSKKAAQDPTINDLLYPFANMAPAAPAETAKPAETAPVEQAAPQKQAEPAASSGFGGGFGAAAETKPAAQESNAPAASVDNGTTVSKGGDVIDISDFEKDLDAAFGAK